MTRSSSREEDRDAVEAASELPAPAILFASLEAARSIVLAVSGGPDSTALMHMAAIWAAEATRPALTVASVDHGLRNGSAETAAAVVRVAEALGLPGRVLAWTGPKPQRAIQEQARMARYARLDTFAHAIGASHLVTAHTMDDQAETVLFRMARGSGPAGLRGMSALSDRGGLVHARPLLGLRKSTLVAACRKEGWPYADDPANLDAAFARTRWRRLLPLIATEGLTPERISRLAERITRGDEALRRIAAEVHSRATRDGNPTGRCYAMSVLASEPEEIVIRVIAAALSALTGNDRLRLNRLEALVTAILHHHAAGHPLRRTLHGCRIVLGTHDRIEIQCETPRRRGAIGHDSTLVSGENPPAVGVAAAGRKP